MASAVDHKHAADTTVAQEDSRTVKRARKSSTAIQYTDFEKTVKCHMITLGAMADEVATICLDYSLPLPGEMSNPPIRLVDANGRSVLFDSSTCDTLSVWGFDDTRERTRAYTQIKLRGTVSMTNPFEFLFKPSTGQSREWRHGAFDWRKEGPCWTATWTAQHEGADTFSVTTTSLIDGTVTSAIAHTVKLYAILTRYPLHHMIYRDQIYRNNNKAPTHITVLSLVGPDHCERKVRDSVPYLKWGKEFERGAQDGHMFEVAPGRFIQPHIDEQTSEHEFYDCRIQYETDSRQEVLVKTKLARPARPDPIPHPYLRIEWMRDGDVLVIPASKWWVGPNGIVDRSGKSIGSPAVVVVWFDNDSWDFETVNLAIDPTEVPVSPRRTGYADWFERPSYVVCGGWLVVAFESRGVAFRFSLDIRVLRQQRAEAKSREISSAASVELA